MHWIGVGILIFIGLAIAPYVIGLAMLLIPGIVCGGIGFFLSMWLCAHCQDNDSILAAILLCTIGGFLAPYGLMYAARK